MPLDGRAARRVALLADTHGALADGLVARLHPADLIVHAGDVGNAAVLAELAALAPVHGVHGNNDTAQRWARADRCVLEALPEALEIALPGGILVVVHGHQWRSAARRHAALRAAWPDARAIVYGHSHRRVIDDAARPWVLNPGAAGRARAYGGAGWLGLTVDGRRWRVAEGRFPSR